jgi:hypothetical protein
VSEEVSDRDRRLRGAIDEWERAMEEVGRVRAEGERWQQENPPPTQPRDVESLAEIERFERENEEWNVPYREHMGRLTQAQVRRREAENEVVKLLQPNYNYVYRGKRYYIDQGGVSTR